MGSLELAPIQAHHPEPVNVGSPPSVPVHVTSECTALLSQKLGFRGVWDSGFSLCAVPTYYCGSKYFYSQHPQVWNLIRTEHSLNRGEHRVKNKAKLRVFPIFINQSSELFPVYRNWIMSDVGSDQRSSRQ